MGAAFPTVPTQINPWVRVTAYFAKSLEITEGDSK